MLSIAHIVPSLAIILDRKKKLYLRVMFCFKLLQIDYRIRVTIFVLLLADIFLAGHFHSILKANSRTKLSKGADVLS